MVGLSILSGAHMTLLPRIVAGLRAQGLDDVLVTAGGIIPDDDVPQLKEARASTPSSGRAPPSARSRSTSARTSSRGRRDRRAGCAVGGSGTRYAPRT